MRGVPYYCGFLKKGLSLSQNIDDILFAKNAPLKEECKHLYASVFKKPDVYVKIIETLGLKKVGMTRVLKEMPKDEHFWTKQMNTPVVNTWLGLAFERVCMEHVNQIKMKLGISGVLTDVNSWYCKADPDRGMFGSQIDMLITRKDQVIYCGKVCNIIGDCI